MGGGEVGANRKALHTHTGTLLIGWGVSWANCKLNSVKLLNPCLCRLLCMWFLASSPRTNVSDSIVLTKLGPPKEQEGQLASDSAQEALCLTIQVKVLCLAPPFSYRPPDGLCPFFLNTPPLTHLPSSLHFYRHCRNRWESSKSLGYTSISSLKTTVPFCFAAWVTARGGVGGVNSLTLLL